MSTQVFSSSLLDQLASNPTRVGGISKRSLEEAIPDLFSVVPSSKRVKTASYTADVARPGFQLISPIDIEDSTDNGSITSTLPIQTDNLQIVTGDTVWIPADYAAAPERTRLFLFNSPIVYEAGDPVPAYNLASVNRHLAEYQIKLLREKRLAMQDGIFHTYLQTDEVFHTLANMYYCFGVAATESALSGGDSMVGSHGRQTVMGFEGRAASPQSKLIGVIHKGMQRVRNAWGKDLPSNTHLYYVLKPTLIKHGDRYWTSHDPMKSRYEPVPADYQVSLDQSDYVPPADLSVTLWQWIPVAVRGAAIPGPVEVGTHPPIVKKGEIMPYRMPLYTKHARIYIGWTRVSVQEQQLEVDPVEASRSYHYLRTVDRNDAGTIEAFVEVRSTRIVKRL